MTKLDLAKTAVTFVVGAGTTKIVGGIIKNNVSPENAADTVAVTSATLVIGMMAADRTKKYTDALIDETIVWFKTNVKK
jgi:hypothetical protein